MYSVCGFPMAAFDVCHQFCACGRMLVSLSRRCAAQIAAMRPTRRIYMLGKLGDKFHKGPHRVNCPSRDPQHPNGAKHRSPCNELPDQITEAPPKEEAQRGPRRGPNARQASQRKTQAKIIGIGDADTQPNGAWFEPLESGLTTFGGSLNLAKRNVNFGRIEFPEPSSYDDGDQILHNGSPFSIHNASLGEAKVSQSYEFMVWPSELDIEDVLKQLSG